ncbi:MAG: substrate-binding domain-containing protein [Clostridiales bacterium]|nr:substrate-binding domain-containing protein [Clostridiales bacterium]
MLGVIVGDITDRFFVELISGVEEEAVKDSMILIIGNTGESSARQQSQLDMLLSYSCRDFVIAPVDESPSLIEMLRGEKANFVIADRIITEAVDFDQVGINNRLDSFRAVEYLLERGHRNIMIVNQLSELRTETDRTKGYLEAMRSWGAPVREEHICQFTSQANIGKLAYDIQRMAHRPTAIYIAKDTLALATVSALSAGGIRVPEDISVILYGNPDWSQKLTPAFTCMERPVKELGRMAVRIIMQNRSGARAVRSERILLDSRLVIQNSVREI